MPGPHPGDGGSIPSEATWAARPTGRRRSCKAEIRVRLPGGPLSGVRQSKSRSLLQIPTAEFLAVAPVEPAVGQGDRVSARLAEELCPRLLAVRLRCRLHEHQVAVLGKDDQVSLRQNQ